MTIGLGIDTGGTFTDAAVVDLDTKEVLFRTKSPTTREDLALGIAAVLRELPADLTRRIGMASLSTTLATNACVEGKGAHTGLILMGFDEALFHRLGGEYGLQDNVTVRFLPGRHGQRGEVEHEPDWAALRALCLELKPQVAALGICEFWGIRNPEYEQEARRIAREATGLPVAVAHELTDEINSLRRAATTSLNARLIPLIDDLLSAVRRALGGQGIAAPLMVVRGDGSLMTEAFARERPVETLLSGPAASLVGGMALCGLRDAVIVDIGGTTTDVAIMRHGRATLAQDGVQVGGFRTGTRAVSIRTEGLGGDSLITHDRFDVLTLGPRRAVPISSLAGRRAGLVEALDDLREENVRRTYHRGEGFVLGGPLRIGDLTDAEQRILSALQAGPLFIEELAAALGQPPYFLPVQRLEFLGGITRFGLTLTDLWHLTGGVALYDAEVARAALDLLAARLGMLPDALQGRVLDMGGEALYRVIAEFLLERRPHRALPGEKPEPHGRLLHLGWLDDGEEIDVRFVSPLPLVGIGAPTHLLLPAAAEAMRTTALIPTDAGVANAVGAITGSVLAEERVHIKPHYEPAGITGFSCHSSAGYQLFLEYEDAMRWAKEEAVRLAIARAHEMGAGEVEPVLELEEQTASARGEAAPMLLGSCVVARGMGKLRFEG